MTMKKSCFRRSRALFTLFLVLCLLANTVIVSAQPATPPQPAPGYGVVLLSGVSQNTQTMPAMLWVANDGQDVYVAIKSNHDVNEVIFGSHSSTDLTVYAPGQFIVVEGKQYDPKEGLSGTIQKAHWTLARFDGPATPNNVLSQVEQDESGSYIIFTVWVGSWSPGQSVQNQKFYFSHIRVTKRQPKTGMVAPHRGRIFISNYTAPMRPFLGIRIRFRIPIRFQTRKSGCCPTA